MKCLIENPATVALCIVMGFLDSKYITAAKILQHLCCICGPIVKSEAKLQQLVRQLKDDQTKLHNEDHSALPLCRESNNKSHENRQFTISELSRLFPQISRTCFREIVAETLHHHNVCV